MKSVNIHEAKTHLSKLLDKVQEGESVIIAKAGKPVAQLVPFVSMSKERKAGVLAGQITEAEDAWDLDNDLASSMTAGPLVYADAEETAHFSVAEEVETYGGEES